MSQAKCEQCPFRAKYDSNPRSILGRIWRFHINFCPGWKSYMRSLPEDSKKALKEKYGLR
ncbi:MAG TPA: hypothetical protein PKY31_16580 [Spirochaetota bacterium]|nr:hypothetical protein [Spirochaetota bacterium]